MEDPGDDAGDNGTIGVTIGGQPIFASPAEDQECEWHGVGGRAFQWHASPEEREWATPLGGPVS